MIQEDPKVMAGVRKGPTADLGFLSPGLDRMLTVTNWGEWFLIAGN